MGYLIIRWRLKMKKMKKSQNKWNEAVWLSACLGTTAILIEKIKSSLTKVNFLSILYLEIRLQFYIKYCL